MANIPKEKKVNLRRKIKNLTKQNSMHLSLKEILSKINPILRGWGFFYQHASHAGKDFSSLDTYVYMRIYKWLFKKHRGRNIKKWYLKNRKRSGVRGWHTWSSDAQYLVDAGILNAEDCHYTFMQLSESPVHNEKCTPGLGGHQ